MDTADSLLDFYYQIRARYGRKRPHSTRSRYQTEIDDIERYLKWCEARQLPPRLFMEKRFESIWRSSHKRSLPRPNQLCGERLAAAWPHFEDQHYSEVRDRRLQQQSIDETRVSVRELRADPLPHQERVKLNHIDDATGCIAMQRYSGGYHPKSAVCRACPMSTPCAAQLQQSHGFDVVALRTGQFNRLPSNILQAALG